MIVSWQAAKAWRGELTGHGPSTVGETGCVLFTLVHLAREFTDARTLDPVVALRRLRQIPGAFVDRDGNPGDLMRWPIAAPAFGLEVDDRTEGKPGSVALMEAIGAALDQGGAAVRVATDDTGKGRHTIAAVRRQGGRVVCVCSALAREIELEWPGLENLGVHWGADAKPYRVVGVRAVRGAVN